MGEDRPLSFLGSSVSRPWRPGRGGGSREVRVLGHIWSSAWRIWVEAVQGDKCWGPSSLECPLPLWSGSTDTCRRWYGAGTPAALEAQPSPEALETQVQPSASPATPLASASAAQQFCNTMCLGVTGSLGNTGSPYVGLGWARESVFHRLWRWVPDRSE